MALYPGWGAGSRINIVGWTAQLDADTAVRFRVDRDNVERFGYFRAMDIFRLWAANALTKVASRVYTEINDIESEDTRAEKRRRVEHDVDNAVATMVQRGDIYIYTTQKSSTENAQSATYNVYKYTPQNNGIKTAAIEKIDLYAVNPARFCETLKYPKGAQPPAKSPRSHYGFNETNGIRSWMLGAGYKLAHNAAERSEMAPVDLEAPPDSYQVMRNAVSLDSLAADLEDTLVAAVAGLVVEAAPSSRKNRTYVCYTVGYDGLDPLDPVSYCIDHHTVAKGDTILDAATLGIGQDALPPIAKYFDVIPPQIVIAAPASRSLVVNESALYFDAAIPTPITTQHVGMHPAQYVDGNPTYSILRGVAASAHAADAKAAYAVPGNTVLEIARKTTRFQWVLHQESGAYGLKADGTGKWIAEIELVPFTGIFVAVPLQRSKPPNVTFHTTANDDSYRHIAAITQLIGPRSAADQPTHQQRKAACLNAMWEASEADWFLTNFRSEIPLPYAQGQTTHDFPPNCDPATITKIEHWHQWHTAIKSFVAKERYSLRRYTVADTPPALVPFSPDTNTVLWTHNRIAQEGYSYVAAAPFKKVAFCEELYRPAAFNAANPHIAFDEHNPHFESIIVRPHGYASAPKQDRTQAFLNHARTAARSIARRAFAKNNVFELVPVRDIDKNILQHHPDTPLVEFYAPGDNAAAGWSMNGTPMALIDALELGIACLHDLAPPV